jgi:hypothetical protein
MVQTEEIVSELKARFSGIDPILVLAPTPRCGSTLIQRAINLGGDAIIYGENFLLAEYAPNFLAGELDDLALKAKVCDATLAQFLSGKKGMDASNLYPDYMAYRRKALMQCFEMADFYRDESLKLGYARWGLKHQIRHLAMFRKFLHLLPRFRAVTVYRDVVDVARSVMARWPQDIKDERQAFAYGRLWRNHLRYLFSVDPGLNLMVRYEDLLSRQDEVIDSIERHLGLRLGRDAFARRVNTHSFDLQREAPIEDYAPPAPLPDALRKALLAGASPLLQELGYSPVLASQP